MFTCDGDHFKREQNYVERRQRDQERGKKTKQRGGGRESISKGSCCLEPPILQGNGSWADLGGHQNQREKSEKEKKDQPAVGYSLKVAHNSSMTSHEPQTKRKVRRRKLALKNRLQSTAIFQKEQSSSRKKKTTDGGNMGWCGKSGKR